MGLQVPNCQDCDDNIPHGVAGYCLVSDGSPVLVVTTVDCHTGDASVSLVDPATGNTIPTEPIQACASLSLETIDSVDCDDVVTPVDALPVVQQGVLQAKLCDNTIISVKDAELDNLNHEIIIVPDSPATVGLTIPAGTDTILVENIVASNRSVRWRGDGTNPLGGGLSGAGHYLVPGATISYSGDPADLLFTKDQLGGNAVLEVSYYQYV